MNFNSLIYGKNITERIVSIEVGDGSAEIFRELEDGSVVSETIQTKHYILYPDQLSDKFQRLQGNQYFKYLMEYDSLEKFNEILSQTRHRRIPHYVIRDPKEALMVRDGYTYFKGMKVEDVSVLSVDLETTGVVLDKTSKILLISNTFRKKGRITRKLFSADEYDSQADMLLAWAEWVREMNPSVITGHYLYGFDLPYLSHVAKLNGIGLALGRDLSQLIISNRTSAFRKDGSQAYDYNNAFIYGREIVDTWFLSMKYDVAARREYEEYGLKYIIKHEGLERKGRQHYDAGTIKDNWDDPVERTKIKIYAVDDADDALKLYDLMIPSLFYYTQSIPRSFQNIVNTATGSQINSLMVRAYLQDGHSIAQGSEQVEFEGAISFGVPGKHKNVFKIDVQSLYPSIILSKRICNRQKDPKELFLKLVEYFTAERIRNKELGETTGERYYKDLSDSQKIAINSMYGFLGAPKLNYNSPADAAEVTRVGREILKTAIKWATGSDYVPKLEESETEDAA